MKDHKTEKRPTTCEEANTESDSVKCVVSLEDLCVPMLGADNKIHQFDIQTQRIVCGMMLAPNQPKSGEFNGNYYWCCNCPDF